MILTTNQDYITTENGKFSVGDRVRTIAGDYAGLSGYIKEIRTGNDKDTENETDDIYCCFDIPESEVEIKLLEEHFSDLYDEPKKIDDLCFDLVIMAPYELEVVKDNE